MNKLTQLLNTKKVYFSPFFLARIGIKNVILEILKTHRITGSIIDIGCGNKPYKNLFPDCTYVGIDFKNFATNDNFGNSEVPDFFFNKEYSKSFTLPFRSQQFNHSCSFEVLEHHQDPKKMLSEMARVTQKGGFILLSFPWLYPIHGEPNDFFRFTKYGFQKIVPKELKIVSTTEIGSVSSTYSLILAEYYIHKVFSSKTNYLLFIFYPFIFFSNYLSLILDKIIISKQIFHHYFILFKKT